MLLCGEFNNAHLDTSFASIDPQNIETTPRLKGLTPKSETALNPIDQRPLTTVYIPLAIFLMFPLFIYVFKTVSEGWRGIKNKTKQNKQKQKQDNFHRHI